MKAENQNIEYKESWRDEYLKWICGFAKWKGIPFNRSQTISCPCRVQRQTLLVQCSV